MAVPTADSGHYRIEIKRLLRPLAQVLQTGGHSIAVRESVLLKVTATGEPSCTGYGEAATLPWFGTETADQAANALAALGNVLPLKAGMLTPEAGLPLAAAVTTAKDRTAAQSWGDAQPQDDTQPWGDALEQVLPTTARHLLSAAPCARWALECALRQAGALPPLAALFTNARATANPAATGNPDPHSLATTVTEQNAALPVAALPVAALLPAGTAAIPQHLLGAGFRVFKIKIGVRSFAEEAASIGALLTSLRQHAQDAAGPARNNATPARSPYRLRLDANGSLPASGLYAWVQRLCPDADLIDFIEQPLRAGQEQQTAEAFADSPLSFAFDESLTSLPQLRQISAQFPTAVLVVKPALLGSSEGFLRWRRHNAQTGQRVIYSSALETGIGLHAALALAAADPLPPEPIGFGTGSLFPEDGLGAPPTQRPAIAFSPTALIAETTAGTHPTPPATLQDSAPHQQGSAPQQEGNATAAAMGKSKNAAPAPTANAFAPPHDRTAGSAAQRLRTAMEVVWMRV